MKDKHTRQLEAKQRAEQRAARTPQQQLKRLDERFGKGRGAVRERARLTKLAAAAG